MRVKNYGKEPLNVGGSDLAPGETREVSPIDAQRAAAAYGAAIGPSNESEGVPIPESAPQADPELPKAEEFEDSPVADESENTPTNKSMKGKKTRRKKG